MLFLLILIFEIIILFFTSKYLFQAIFTIFYRIFKNQKLAVIPVFLLFLPGVVIHEFAHYLMAEILFVGAHDLEIFPKIENGHLKMGSVKTNSTDIVRSAFIGLAPFIMGSIFLAGFLFFYARNLSFTISSVSILEIIFIVWVVFFTTNTMFSSKKDMEGVVGFALLIVLLCLVGAIMSFLLKVNISVLFENFVTNKQIEEILKILAFLFLVPVIVNSVVLLCTRTVLRKI